MHRILLSSFVTLVLCLPPLPGAETPPIDYSREIKPILSNNCYACHGPDARQRKGKLRLDLRPEAIQTAIIPGKATESPLIQRLVTHDPSEVMPPPTSKKGPITAEQVERIRRWIDQGAKFDQHWAYVPPARPALPRLLESPWVINPIDAFVAQGHRDRRMVPSPPADRVTLLRRLHFDLLGLPPQPSEVDSFVKDQAPDAYDKVVDRLLGSEHFGERMAQFWLDLVRYADTGGYHSDNHRDVAPYRDYVIRSFNTNKRFDVFTQEQLAGDLLLGASLEQRIASGYNRLLQTTEEGGAQPKEYTAKYAADRVRNASVVWLAGTMGCAECHDHKFDPYTMKDFYSFAAFFADIQERAVGRQEQTPLPNPEQAARLSAYEGALARLRAEVTKSGKEGEAAKKVLAEWQTQRDAYFKTIPTTLLSQTGPPRTMRILPRGNWLDDSGPIVEPAIPAFLGKVDRQGSRLTRQDLAQWLTSRDNPLTARVFVNRLWKIAFGQGLVRSIEDFGIQGSVPSHPALLDWLAVEFMESGWDIKHILRLIVRSNTYRQSSKTSAQARERDPWNEGLARQSRFRLDAEMVRDNALAISGLLVRSVGGESARPYQPTGYWSFLNFPRREWQNDQGPGLYRRGLYTYWCRTFPHPSLLAFDAPSREECTADRPRSSTPLQALVLLNDPIYVEAARVLAERLLRQGGTDPRNRVLLGFQLAVGRPPSSEETRVLLDLAQKHLEEFRSDADAATRLVSVGQWPLPKDLDRVELAAWTSVARAILNLHETITRP